MNWKDLMKYFLKKKEFYNNLNMEDIANADYTRVCNDFEIKNLGE